MHVPSNEEEACEMSSEESALTVGELIDRIRESYLDELLSTIEDRASEAGAEFAVEAAFLDASGEPVRQGVFALPMRGDVFVLRDDQPVDALLIAPDGVLGFDAVRLEWAEGFEVELCPFHWGGCPLALSPARSVDELAPVVEWFEAWFVESEHADPPLMGVVHALAGPETRDEWTHLEVDLGSAPVRALEELVDACSRSGAKSLRIGQPLAPDEN